MPMQMGFRWYGEGNDQIKLSDIKQIPGVTTIVWALHNKMPGEVWEESEIAEVQKQLSAYGFNMDVVESVNVHDDIKIGKPTRDMYIENYKTRMLTYFDIFKKTPLSAARYIFDADDKEKLKYGICAGLFASAAAGAAMIAVSKRK